MLDGASRGKGACIKFKIFFSRKALGAACSVFTFLTGRMGERGIIARTLVGQPLSNRRALNRLFLQPG